MIKLVSKENLMKSGILLGRVNATVKEFQKFTSVKVVAYGCAPMWWNEAQVRAFQVIAHNANDKDFADLKDNVVIYSGPLLDHRMILRRDGKFENEFEPGFYDAAANMAFEIL